MSDPKHTSPSAPPPIEPESQPDSAFRATFYMHSMVLTALDAQCAVEGNRKRSPFLVELLTFLLISPIGQQLREQATAHQRTLIHELERNLILFNEHLPTDRIKQLAEESQRHPDQMLVRLVLLGLKVYERSVARMQADIETETHDP